MREKTEMTPGMWRRLAWFLWPRIGAPRERATAVAPTGHVSRTIVGAAVLGIVLLLAADVVTRAEHLLAAAVLSVLGVAAVLLGLIHTIRDVGHRLRTRRREERGRQRRVSR